MYEPVSGEGRDEGGENESVEWNGAELIVKRMLHAEGKAETNAQNIWQVLELQTENKLQK